MQSQDLHQVWSVNIKLVYVFHHCDNMTSFILGVIPEAMNASSHVISWHSRGMLLQDWNQGGSQYTEGETTEIQTEDCSI